MSGLLPSNSCSIYLNHLLPDYLKISYMDYFYQTLGLSDNSDGCQNGRHLSVYICGHSNLVIYHPISSKFHIWTTFIKLLFMSEYGFCPLKLIIKIFAKMDIAFSLVGIRRGPLWEADCSSVSMMVKTQDFELKLRYTMCTQLSCRPINE